MGEDVSHSTSVISYVLAAGGWFAFSYLYISIGEHQIHKYLMHRKRLPAWVYKTSAYMLEVFEAHGVRHHTQWYREFDYETDEVGRDENLGIPMKETLLMLVAAFPLWAPTFLFSTFGGCIFLITALIHNRLWTILHRQMHIPQNVFFRDWFGFKFVARNHFMHHQQTNGNFNVAFPFADWIFRTSTQPKHTDIREMLRLGYIQPKSDSGKRLVEKWRGATELRRQLA